MKMVVAKQSVVSVSDKIAKRWRTETHITSTFTHTTGFGPTEEDGSDHVTSVAWVRP